MAWPILHKRYLLCVWFGRRYHLVEQRAYSLCDFDIRHLAIAANRITFARPPLSVSEFNCAAVVIDEDPITDVLPVSIDGNRFSLKSIADNGGNKFLVMLKRTEVVRAVRNNDV